MKHVAAVILAAGKGTRMASTSSGNKVVATLMDKPMISYTIDHLHETGIDQVVVVVGFAQDSVKKALGDAVVYAKQEKPLGTGDALRAALPKIPQECRIILSMYGDDSAFYPAELFDTLIKKHEESQASITLLTIHKDDPTGLGRILRDDTDQVIGIVEEKNASMQQRNITEINTGLYCFDHSFVKENIDSISVNPISGEYYLTDLVEIAVTQGGQIQALCWKNDDVWCGVNTPDQLELARKKMKAL